MIRQATLDDRPEFLRLWQAYLTTQRKEGNYLWDNLHNLHLFLGFFEAYVQGSLKGCVVLCQPEEVDHPVGVAMGGQTVDRPEWETDLGETAILWGLYVEPEYRGRGISAKLFQRAREYGLSVGIQTIETVILDVNAPGKAAADLVGLTSNSRGYLLRLEDPGILSSSVARQALAKGVGSG